MTSRIAKLRQESFEAQPDISVERAVLVTQFYKENYGKFSIPVLRALNFKNLCQKKTSPFQFTSRICQREYQESIIHLQYLPHLF